MACEVMGSQTPTAAPVLRCRPLRPRRSAPAAAPRGHLALGHPDHRCDHPAAGLHARLTSGDPPLRPEKTTTRACGTPPTRRDSRAAAHVPALKKALTRRARPPSQGHGRYGLSMYNFEQSLSKVCNMLGRLGRYEATGGDDDQLPAQVIDAVNRPSKISILFARNN
jgi:hypothetical protein